MARGLNNYYTIGQFLFTDDDGIDVFEPGPLTKILTGNNPGAEPENNYDIRFPLLPYFVNGTLLLDPEPETRLKLVPPIPHDFISAVLKKLGQHLGFFGLRNWGIGGLEWGTFTLGYKTLFDSKVTFDGIDKQVFNGENSIALFGAPVPLSFGVPLIDGKEFSIINEYNLGDCESEKLLLDSVMTWCYPREGRFNITPMDLAVLKDLGYPIISMTPHYSSQTGILHIPFVNVSSQAVYDVELELADAEKFEFVLLKAEPIPLGSNTPATYSLDTGILSIPLVEVVLGESITMFEVEMKLMSGSSPLRFVLTNATPLNTIKKNK